jgi:hypothetical protein
MEEKASLTPCWSLYAAQGLLLEFHQLTDEERQGLSL